MNALIFAAGLGTRLAHITQNKPKALVEVAGKPMLQRAIEKLIEVDVKRIVINVHHHAEAVKEFVELLAIRLQPCGATLLRGSCRDTFYF